MNLLHLLHLLLVFLLCFFCLLPLWPQTEITDESAATEHQEGQEAKHLLSPSPTLKTSMNTQGQIASLHVPIYQIFRCSAFHRDQITSCQPDQKCWWGGEERASGLILKRTHAADKSLNSSELHIQERLFPKTIKTTGSEENQTGKLSL